MASGQPVARPRRPQRAWAQRLLPLLVAVVVLPGALSVSAFLTEQPVRLGQPSPRTVVAPELIRVPDPEATDRARRDAADAVEPVLVDDPDARAAMVQQVRDAFAAVRDVREPDEAGERATRREQLGALRERLPALPPAGLRLLVDADDAEVDALSSEALSVAQQLARQRFTADELATVAEEDLGTELAVRSLPAGAAEEVVAPVVRDALEPTVRVDEEATLQARREAAGAVAPVVRSYPAGSVIVSAGEPVDAVALAALRQRGLEGAEPWREAAKALLVAVLVTLPVAAYLRVHRPRVWRSPRRLLLLACLFAGFAVVLEALTLLVPDTAPAWHYAVPVGAVAMLATILFDPPVGVLSAIPLTALVAFEAPGESGVAAFAALAALASVPFVSRLSARSDLRQAALRSTAVYVLLAAVCAVAFDDLASLGVAVLAGAVNGVLVAMLVNTALPFCESLFGVVTATGLLDLADRNHPLLRELEQKALGSYNHSIMVATMVERAARAVAADPLLASVAALYHDIGKVRRPYFFVENQIGIPNPHDDLEPAVSAVIIQEHVTDGVRMARAYRLPPEVVEGIATHHGTTLVTYFHRKALQAAGPGETVDDEHYRYKGRKPSSREMAILMLADCCEAASRSAAQRGATLSRSELEVIVRTLVAERVEDGQLDESSLTFRDLRVVTASFIETLAGVYHPRIAYPEPVSTPTPGPVPPPTPGAVPPAPAPASRTEPVDG